MSGSTRIDHQLIADSFDRLLVSVSVDDYMMVIRCDQFLRSRTAKLVSVADVNLDSTERNRQLGWEIWVIDRVCVSVNSVYRGDQPELVENFGPPDVTGVDDEVHPLESGMDFRSKKSVSIGDEADNDRRGRSHASYIT